jgi:hypothetical protein
LTIQLASDEGMFFAGDQVTLEGLHSALLREAQIIRTHPNKKASDVTVIIRADRVAKT